MEITHKLIWNQFAYIYLQTYLKYPRFQRKLSCLLCQKLFTNGNAHASCACPATTNIRDLLWIDIVNLFDIRLSAELCLLTELFFGSSRSTNTHPTLSPRICFLLYAQLQTSKHHCSSIQQSDTSCLNEHCDRYITFIYIFNIYLFIHSLVSPYIHMSSSSCILFIVYTAAFL